MPCELSCRDGLTASNDRTITVVAVASGLPFMSIVRYSSWVAVARSGIRPKNATSALTDAPRHARLRRNGATGFRVGADAGVNEVGYVEGEMLRCRMPSPVTECASDVRCCLTES